MILMLHPHNKGNPTSPRPPPTSMEEQTFIVVSAGGEFRCVNLLAPVHAAFASGYIWSDLLKGLIVFQGNPETYQTSINPQHCAVISCLCVVTAAIMMVKLPYQYRPQQYHLANQVMLITGFKHYRDRLGLMTLTKSQRGYCEWMFLCECMTQRRNKYGWVGKKEGIMAATETEPRWITVLTIRLRNHSHKQGAAEVGQGAWKSRATDLRLIFFWGGDNRSW